IKTSLALNVYLCFLFGSHFGKGLQICDEAGLCPEHCAPCEGHCGMFCYECLLEEKCWRDFNKTMNELDNTKWCTWNNISRPYSNFSQCTEDVADCLGIPWPNKKSDDLFMKLHSKHFKNCDIRSEYIEPPLKVMTALVMTPICLIPLMVSLVVWKTKDGEPSS
uniref:Receptor (G protein-coupled) activity modifying protein 2 n=1 Tax=Lepisosteus oculatus TaxID=7918 RepID=W5N3N8_LEPOC